MTIKCISIALMFPLASLSASRGDHPFVLFIAIDDLNDWVGCLDGYPQVQTPNIDALAKLRNWFTNAHCQVPLCNPSRTSVMTGPRPSTTGVFGLARWFRTVDEWKDLVTLRQHFSNAGNKTYSVGKIYHGLGWDATDVTEFDVVSETVTGLSPKEKRVATPRGLPNRRSLVRSWASPGRKANHVKEHPVGPFNSSAARLMGYGTWKSKSR